MTQALALGLGSMFNHSAKRTNVRWKRDTERDYIVYTSTRDIDAGEELLISYGSRVLWFEDVDGQEHATVLDTGRVDMDADVDTGGGTLAELELSGLSEIEFMAI
jgi:SET domain-containing protein